MQGWETISLTDKNGFELPTAHAQIPAWKLSAYGAPAIPIIILWFPLYLYLPAFYTEQQGLDLVVVGYVFFLARLFDGASDLLIGWLSDKTKSSIGGRKIWLIGAAPFLALSAYFLCVPPDDSGPLYLTIWLIAFYVAWTAFQIPYLAWGSDLADDPDQRTRLMGFRGFGTMVGILIAVTVPKLYLGLSQLEFDALTPWWERIGRSFLWIETSPGEILAVLAVLSAICVAVSVVIAASSVPDARARPTHHESSHNLRLMLSVVWRDRVFLRFLAAFFLFDLGYSITNVTLYFVIEVSHGYRGQLLTFTLGAYLLAIAIMPLMVRIAGNIGSGRAFCLLAGSLGIAMLLWLAAPRGNLAMVSLGYIVYAFCESLVWVIPPALVADAAHRAQLHSGSDQAGIFMASFNLLWKTCLALGPVIAFPLLAIGGFEPALGDRNSDLALEAVRWFGLGVPILLIGAAIAVMWQYPQNVDRTASSAAPTV